MNTKILRRIGLAILAAGSLSALSSSATAQTNFTLLKSFNGNPDGVVPYNSLAADTNLVLYGTAVGGGISNIGTVFRLNADGSGFSVLKGFTGPDGSGPRAGLVLGSDGNLYGTTWSGGSANFGTIFTLNRSGGGFAVLHSFTGSSDSKNPSATLIEGSDGALYGTTEFADSATRGTVFKINKNGGGYSILHTFTGNPDGQQPQARLLEGSDGRLYGTTSFGGNTVVGTIFGLNKDGSGYGLVYTFQTTGGDGRQPEGGLIEGSDHALYGTTYHGGSTGGAGTVFKINKDGGGYLILRSFSSAGADGQRPNAELVEGADGALYGGNDFGNPPVNGTIYKINKDGSGYAILRSFVNANGDGGTPKCGLIQLKNGAFYGTTEYGGLAGAGCVFALSSAPLPPRVSSLSVSAGSNFVQFATTSATQYDVQRSTNLSSWLVLTTLTSPTNGQINYKDLTPPVRSAFYRLQQH